MFHRGLIVHYITKIGSINGLVKITSFIAARFAAAGFGFFTIPITKGRSTNSY